MAKRRAHGEGTLYYSETLKRWVGQITLPGGKRRTKYGKTQKVVKEWVTAQSKALQDGVWVADDQVTFGAFLDRYMQDVAPHKLRETTIQAHSSLIRNHIIPGIGKIKVAALRPDHLQSLYTEKLNSGLSPRTVQYMHSIIHKSLDQALRWGLVVRNVADLVDPPTPKRKQPQTLSAEQVKRFLRVVKDHRFYPIYMLASATGMREAEILSLHWSDINLEGKSLYVRYTLQVIKKKGMQLADPKTEASKRVIPLPNYVVECLQGLPRSSERVFTTATGNWISPRNLIRHFKAALVKADLPDMTFHAFSRHTHATLLLAAGVHPKVVQERLGHSQISLTLDTYSHVMPHLQQEAADKINAMITANTTDES